MKTILTTYNLYRSYFNLIKGLGFVEGMHIVFCFSCQCYKLKDHLIMTRDGVRI